MWPKLCLSSPAVLLLALVALVAVGCGGTARPPTAPVRPVVTSRSPVAAAPTTTANATSSSPELILCREEPRFSPQLVALSGGQGGVSVTTLASFTGTHHTGECSASPDLTKLATLSTTAEGSTVAGYLPAGSGGFVNVSGHETNDYSGVSHVEGVSLFNPVTGELWWSSDHLWSSALNSSQPHDHGVGQLGVFNAAGEPRAYKWSPSPDGSIQAFAKDLEEIHYSQGLGLAIGHSRNVTAACENRAVRAASSSPGGIGASDFARACPGVAHIAFETTCDTFVGLISDSELICGLTKDSGQRFYRVGFVISGDQVKIVSHVPLTPTTTMEIGWTAVSPDGKALWYMATSGTSTPEATEQTRLYIVPTSNPTREPSPVSLTPEVPLETSSVVGWRWHDHWLDGAP